MIELRLLEEKSEEPIKKFKKIIGNSIKAIKDSYTTEIYKSLAKRITYKELNKLKKILTDEQYLELKKLQENIDDIFKSYIELFPISEKSKEVIKENFRNQIMAEYSTQIEQMKNGTISIMSNIIKTSMDFDNKFLKSQILKWDPKDFDKNIKKFENLFKKDYEQQYMQALMKDKRIKMFFDGEKDFIQLTKGGRLYDLEKYLEQSAESTVKSITNNLIQEEIKIEEYDLLALVQFRNPKEPRESHLEYQYPDNEIYFSFFNEKEKYEGIEVLNIEVLEKLPEDDKIYRSGNYPAGCGHLLIPMPEIEKKYKVA